MPPPPGDHGVRSRRIEPAPRGGRSDANLHRIEAELALGRQIQRSFVPLIPPDLPGYEVATQYEPAREVGGDFFDVFRIRAGRGAWPSASPT